MPSVTVGYRTVFTSIDDDGHLAELKRLLLEQAYLEARTAYEAGNLQGLVEALALFSKHASSEDGCPRWIVDGAARELERRSHDGDAEKPRGRHSNEWTRRKEDAADWVRATVVLRELSANPSETAAYKKAAKVLAGAPGGTEKVMAAAFKRFLTRYREDPSRYYPLSIPLELVEAFVRATSRRIK